MKGKNWPLYALGAVGVLGLGAVLLASGEKDRGEAVLTGGLLSDAGPASYRVFQEGDVFVGEFTLPQGGGVVELEGTFDSADEAEDALIAELESRGFFQAGR